jgi:outer membrane lipoprotein-sorting protein
MKRILITIILLFSVAISAQTKDAKKIIDAVHQKFDKVNDYQADVTVKLNMSAIKVPDMKAKVFFKKPDKIKIESDGFAMLPKQGLKFSPADLFKGEYTSLYIRSEMMDNRKIDVIKNIPTSDSSDVILTTLWIDTDGAVIRKVETTTKKGGTSKVELTYDNFVYALPSQIKITLNFGDSKIPDNAAGKKDPNINPDQKNNRRGGMSSFSMNGNITMTYMNYKINKGIPDSIFNEKEKKK